MTDNLHMSLLVAQTEAAAPPLPADAHESIARRAESGSTAAERLVCTSLRLLAELYHYNHWLFDRVRPFISGRVCEVGSGTGNVTQFILNQDEVVGIEPSPSLFEEARFRFRQHQNTRFVNCLLEDCPNAEVSARFFDTVLCLNVLEHIEDDVRALRLMRELCRPGGQVVILVPAHMSIYGQLDRCVGHYRRYNRRGLREIFARAGLRPVRTLYMNWLGYFAWGWQSRCLGREEISISGARFFNRLVPFLDALERLIPLPFGQSLIMVGEPTAE